MTLLRLHEVLSILMMHDAEAAIQANLDTLYIGGPSQESLKPEYVARLKELGAFWNDTYACWQMFT